MLSRVPKVMPYKYIIFIAMLFITIDLAAVSVAYKMVSINSLFEINSAATFIFPLTYALGDVLTEVYGYNLAKKTIWFSLLLQFVFAILVTLAIHLPSPVYWNDNKAYEVVYGTIIRFVLAGTAANIASNFINIYIVSKLKIPMEGKYFWFRSILSTLISGFILVSVIILFGFYGNNMDLAKAWIMFKSTYSLEVVYAACLVVPSAMLAAFLKSSENVDVYDDHTNFNPFFINKLQVNKVN